jgi:phospholipid/cholesterol/gamma-HCH transport system substrate-binding protein
MKKNFSDYIVALGVLACSLVLLAALTIALGGWAPKKAGHNVDIDYPDITGIRLHSQVRYAGAPAGTVSKIRLLSDEERNNSYWSAVRVTVQFFDGVPALPNDVRASLGSDSLLGEKFIALSSGSPGNPKLTDGTVLHGASGGSIDSLIESVGPLVESLKPMLDSVDKTLKGLDQVVGKAGSAVDTFKDGVVKLTDGFKGTADSATQAVQRIDKLVADVNDPVKEDLKKLQSALAQIQQTLATADKLLGRTDKNLDSRMEELGVVLQNLKVATTNAKSLTKTLAEKPNRILFSGKQPPLPTENEILRSSKPVPVR